MKIAKRTIQFALPLLLLTGLLMGQVQAAVLQDFSGKPKSIGDFTGQEKWTVVMIWASDCHICNKEASAYVDFHFAHSDDDARVLGISIDGQAKKAEAEKFIERHKITFPNLIGEPQDVAQLYHELTGATFIGTPVFLFYNPQGELVAQQAGAVPTELIEEFIRQQSVAASNP